MKRSLFLPAGAFMILIFGALGFSKPSTDISHFVTVERIADTPEAKEVIKTAERAYDIEAEALYTI